MTDSAEMRNETNFRPFEGMWLLAKHPTGGLECAKTINGRLLIPFSFSEQKKAVGHFFDCRVVNGKLLCRFENFDSAASGVLYLTVGPNDTLTGGRWIKNKIPEMVLKDIAFLSESLPGKQDVVWIRIPNTETPSWAEKYFAEDWPNMGSI